MLYGCCVVFVCSKLYVSKMYLCFIFFFFQAEDGIRDLVRSRGLGDVYKRQVYCLLAAGLASASRSMIRQPMN